MHIGQNSGISKLQEDMKKIDKSYMDFIKLVKSRMAHHKDENIELLKETCSELMRLKHLLEMKVTHME